MRKIKKKKDTDIMRSPFDINGSYTGTCADGDKPIQDADDL